MIDYEKINLNEYALKLRSDGKTFKQIGNEVGLRREQRSAIRGHNTGLSV